MQYFDYTPAWHGPYIYQNPEACFIYQEYTRSNDNMPSYAIMVDKQFICSRYFDKELSTRDKMFEEMKYAKEQHISPLGVKLVEITP